MYSFRKELSSLAKTSAWLAADLLFELKLLVELPAWLLFEGACLLPAWLRKVLMDDPVQPGTLGYCDILLNGED